MKQVILLRTIFLICFSSVCFAGRGQYFFKQLTEENGLSDNRVTCFLKDRTGFLWIGTKKGLNRYDGHSFKAFNPARGNSISNEAINDIIQDSAGRIWVATMAGLNIYDPLRNTWETIMPDGSDSSLPNYIIWDIETDKNNNIWIVADSWAFSKYDPVRKKFTFYDWPSFKRQPIFDKFPRYRSIQKITRKNDKEWWLATTIGLFSVDIESRQFRFYGAGYSGNCLGIYYDLKNKTVFTATEHGKLFCYDMASDRYSEIPVTQQAYPAVQWNGKAVQRPDMLLLPHPGGMLEINSNSKEASLIVHRPALSSSLLPGGTSEIYKDNTGMIWVGTANGINYYSSRNRAADFIPLTIASDKESVDDMSSAVYDAMEGRYYVTSLQAKKLFIINDSSGQINTIASIDGKPLTACTNVCFDRQNNLWLLTETHVYRYDREKRKFNLFPTPNKGSPVIFHDILLDQKGDYWLATWRDGLYHYKTKEDSFRQFTEKDDINTRIITSLINDPSGKAIWIGTFSAGVSRYDLETGRITNYTEDPSIPEYKQLHLITDIESDNSGKLWLTTIAAGLYVYIPGNSYEKLFRHVTVKDGLMYSSYHAATKDDRNRLWLLSGKGLSVINPNQEPLTESSKHPVFDITNHAPNTHYPKRISYNNVKKEILVPVAGGLMLYYLDKEPVPDNSAIVFTDISVDGKSIIHDSSWFHKKNIEIPYKSNSISFQFAALNYEARENIQYEYKLNNGDEWKTGGISNVVNFPGLSPGSYRFIVRARNGEGQLFPATASFEFRINPPFWKTAWFIAFITAGLLLGLFFWIRSLQRKIKAEKILTYFATSLYGQNTVDDIFWDVAKNCISKLKFEDCVIYLADPEKKLLIQKAAYGPKNPQKHEIVNALAIPYGKGIVGAVAVSQKPLIIANTTKDTRYILDDQRRNSEIAVPVFVDGKLFGVIDSEHSRKYFYTRWHLRLLQKIAEICSHKVSRWLVAEKVRTDIARDLHDEMGSTLTSINIISKLALQQEGTVHMNTNLQKIKDYSGNMMESMSDIVWAINPMNDSMDRMILRMRELAEELLEPAKINYVFREEGAVKMLKLDVNQRKELYLVFKEAINNAVKYSMATVVTIILRKEQGHLRLEVNDNGTGFDISRTWSGSGIRNMYDRAEKINSMLYIDSATARGTSVTLTVPLPIT